MCLVAIASSTLLRYHSKRHRSPLFLFVSTTSPAPEIFTKLRRTSSTKARDRMQSERTSVRIVESTTFEIAVCLHSDGRSTAFTLKTGVICISRYECDCFSLSFDSKNMYAHYRHRSNESIHLSLDQKNILDIDACIILPVLFVN